MFKAIWNGVVGLVRRIRNIHSKVQQVQDIFTGATGFMQVGVIAVALMISFLSPGPEPFARSPEYIATFHATTPCATCGWVDTHRMSPMGESSVWRKCSNCDYGWEESL